MKITPTIAKRKLDSAISSISDISWLYSKDPESDFTRERKLPMDSVLRLLLKFSGKSLQGEISAYYSPPRTISRRVPTKSAFTQQRQKLLCEGCYALFRSFTESLPYLKLFDGYRLLACDGSTVQIPRNETETDFSVKTREDHRAFNQLHINGLFDILNRIYADAVVDPGWYRRESAALLAMVNRLGSPESSIILADRGYEGYNTIAHLIESMVNFVIRAKDLDSNGFLHTLHLPPDGELDTDVSRILTTSRARIYQNDDRYAWIHRRAFDLWDSSGTYDIRFRLVRILLPDGTYECLVTNLPRDKFPPEKLKKLYHLRWGIENAYRDLKYPVDLLHFHGKSAQAVLQELFCSLTMFNYCAYLCVHAEILHIHKGTKYRYKVNFANAVGPCRSYLHGSISEMELLDRLRLAPTPIRPDRHVPRPSRMNEQSSREFNYRAS